MSGLPYGYSVGRKGMHRVAVHRASLARKGLVVKISSSWGALLAILLVFGACSDTGTEGSTSSETSQEESGSSSTPAAEASPEEPTAEEFIAEADEICTVAAQGLDDLDEVYFKAKTKKETAEADDQFLSLINERLVGLEGLTPPSELADDYDQYLEFRRQALDSVERDFEEKDEKASKVLRAETDQLIAKVSKAGREIGFAACANRLSPEAEKEVKANLSEFFIEASPAAAKSLVSGRLLRLYKKGPGALLKQTGLVPSEKVIVRKIQGVEGVSASSEVNPKVYGKQILVVELTYEDGTYKVSSYGPKN